MLTTTCAKNLYLLIFLLAGSITACADVFQWQDADGKAHYTDRNRENSHKLSINPERKYFTVVRIQDGDTLTLDDDRKIRLLGINTPEVRHGSNEAEAGGEAAKKWLKARLLHKRIRLIGDTEATDKYGRTLAHVFTENDEHINKTLVETGLAAVNIYPPNLLYSDDLIAAGEVAELAKRGIWGLKAYDSKPVEQAGFDGHTGWQRLTGKILTIKYSRKSVFLHLSPRLQVRIEKAWLDLFPPVKSYLGKSLEVRGKLSKHDDGWTMLVRHPSAIKAKSD